MDLREEYKKLRSRHYVHPARSDTSSVVLSGKEVPQKLSNSTLQKYINWHTQAKEQNINWRKLEQSFLSESKITNSKNNLLFKDGTKLLRHWKGNTYTVITQNNQFIFNNKPYKSLLKTGRFYVETDTDV